MRHILTIATRRSGALTRRPGIGAQAGGQFSLRQPMLVEHQHAAPISLLAVVPIPAPAIRATLVLGRVLSERPAPAAFGAAAGVAHTPPPTVRAGPTSGTWPGSKSQGIQRRQVPHHFSFSLDRRTS